MDRIGGDFGEDDELGRINLITDERRRAATGEVRTGRCSPLTPVAAV